MYDEKEPLVESACLAFHRTMYWNCTAGAAYNFAKWRLEKKVQNFFMWKFMHLCARVHLHAVAEHAKELERHQVAA